MSQAVTQIKSELGPNAVILSSKRIKSKGLISKLGGPGTIEVTAAVDVVGKRVADDGITPQARPKLSKVLDNLTGEHFKPIHDQLGQMQQQLDTISDSVETSSALFEEISQLKELISHVSATEKKADQKPSTKVIDDIVNRLLWHRMDSQLVGKLVDDVMDQRVDFNIYENVRDNIAKLIFDRLPETKPIDIEAGKQFIGAVIGPTGAGKTTTLVKLASEFVLERKASIAFINLDQFRIGAQEQLKHYADILGCPCVSVSNKQELNKAIEELSDMDVILIDTTGRSFNDRRHLADLGHILSLDVPVVKHLVMPANTQEPETSEIINRYDLVGIDRIIISKLDEAVSFGTLVNTTIKSNLPLAYFTVGQQVPDDLEHASKERIVDCLFNYSGDFNYSDQLRKRSNYNMDTTAINSKELPI